ncbi:hypothetical protein ABBQ32_003961 [Trebouxia sp. C0010 RCD-2024]
MDGVLSKLKSLDAYPKVNEDFFTRTYSGGVITVVSSLVMLCLFISELSLWLRMNTFSELSVDTSRGEMMDINFDITFHKMPCAWTSLDAMDISGEMHLDVDHDVYKKRLQADGTPIDEGTKHTIGPENLDLMSRDNIDENGTVCGSCYGAQTTAQPCCNTCDEVRSAYRKKGWAFTDPQGIEQCAQEGFSKALQEQAGEGCHMWGAISINKVAGNVHFAPGKSFQQGNMHVHDLVPFPDKNFDLSHTITKLTFGQGYPGQQNPLDGVFINQTTSTASQAATGMWQYFLKVVPTMYSDVRNNTIFSNQYSVTEHFKPADVQQGQNMPGVFFFYDLSPIKVQYREEYKSFTHFITSVCAIIGGVFTVSGLIDSFIYHGQKAIKKKVDLGKQI